MAGVFSKAKKLWYLFMFSSLSGSTGTWGGLLPGALTWQLSGMGSGGKYCNVRLESRIREFCLLNKLAVIILIFFAKGLSLRLCGHPCTYRLYLPSIFKFCTLRHARRNKNMVTPKKDVKIDYSISPIKLNLPQAKRSRNTERVAI